MKTLAIALALTLLPAPLALAQSGAGAAKPLLENEQIRVRELRLAPGARQPATARPNTFLYALTDGALVLTPPGRAGYELSFKAGEALWLPAQEMATANEGSGEVRALIVEMKARPPAARKSRPAKAKPSKESSKKN